MLKEKMKILFLLNQKDLSFEGSLVLVKNLINNLRRKNTIFVNDIKKKKESDIINLHSSGFSDKKPTKNLIYSLHSNVSPHFFKSAYDMLQFYSRIYDSKRDHLKPIKRVKKIMFLMVSQLIPCFVKRIVLKKSKLVIVPNKFTHQKLRINNSIIVRQGIDIKKFKKLKRKHKNSNDKVQVSFIGHPAPAKGLMEVVTAFSRLNSKKYVKNLFLSYKHNKIERHIRKKSRSINVFGFRKNILNDYNESDIVVLPYRHSGGTIATPLVLLEAMACEKAIITTNLPHIKEICGDSVIYVEPYSVKQIVKAVKFLTGKPQLRQELGQKARAIVLKNYDQEDMFRKYEEIYKKFKS